jgi:mRNA-degrading endonuclease RelE of RelBE toxin-antitoxin system
LTNILVRAILVAMAWTVVLRQSVIEDLRWFGRPDGRLVLDEIERLLSANPLAESRSMKTLRPNRVAQRELRLFGKVRVLFNVDEAAEDVTVVLVGEKRGDALIVQGKEFGEHHESDPAE